MDRVSGQDSTVSCSVPGCGCVTTVLAIVGLLYLLGVLK
jgi:hypothetical protein